MVKLVLTETGTFRDIAHLFHFIELLFVGIVTLTSRGYNLDDVDTVSIPHWPHESWKGKFHNHNEKILNKIFKNFKISHESFDKVSKDVVWIDRAECDKGEMNKMWAKYMAKFNPYLWSIRLHGPERVMRQNPKPVVTYISRQNTNRCLPDSTHRELVAYLKGYSGIVFMPVQMEDYSFEQQLNIASSTDLLIGVHGNGLTHAAFMRPRRNVVEIFPEGMPFQYDYYTLSKMMGHEYTCIYSGGPAFVHTLTLESPPSCSGAFESEILGIIIRQIKKMH